MSKLVFRTVDGDSVTITDENQQKEFHLAYLKRKQGEISDFKVGNETYINTCVRSFVPETDNRSDPNEKNFGKRGGVLGRPVTQP
jgi:hypothetical protein